MSGTLPRFMATGVVNTAIGFAVIIAAREGLGFGDIAANAAGYAAGLICGFVLNRWWTFRHTGTIVPAMLRFALVFAVSYAANVAVLSALIVRPGLWAYLPHLAGMAVYTIVFYTGSRYVAFRT